MEGRWSRITSAVIPRGIVSVPGSLLAVLLGYSFSSQFIPVEPYLVPYLTTVKGFSNFQVAVDIYPISVYAQLAFTLLLAPACFYLSHKAVIILGAFGLLATYVIIWFGQSLLAMQIMQLTYGFGMSARLVFSSYIFHLVLEEEYQIMGENEGWILILKQTWGDQNLRILSLWWAIAFAGMSLVQNYGTNLFDAVDPKSKYNGHVLAISQAAGSLGAYCAIYIEDFASKSGLSIYVIGSSVMGLLCTFMGVIANIWAEYFLYMLISGIYQTLSCLLSVQCGRLLSNGKFILLFSINNFAGLLVETLLQAAVEISGLSIFAQYISFAIFFFVATIAFVGVSFVNCGQSESTAFSNSDSEADHLMAK